MVRQCPACGAFIGPDDDFCGECGRPVDRQQQPPSQAPSPAVGWTPPDRSRLTRPAAPPPRTRLSPVMIAVGIGLALLIVGLGGLAVVLHSFRPPSPVVAATASPAPTLTPLPIPTEPAGPLRDLRSLIAPEPLYRDDFSGPAGGWETEEDEDTTTSYADGEFRIAVHSENYMAWSNPTPPLSLTNLAIQVDARLVEGPLDNNLGLLVRCRESQDTQDTDDFYWYEISSDGYYGVVLRYNDDWRTLIPWEESDAIHQGVGAVNHLQVLCAGELCSFYVNDTWLTDVVDSTILSGTIGLAAGNFDEPGVVVHFDNLAVYELQE